MLGLLIRWCVDPNNINKRCCRFTLITRILNATNSAGEPMQFLIQHPPRKYLQVSVNFPFFFKCKVHLPLTHEISQGIETDCEPVVSMTFNIQLAFLGWRCSEHCSTRRGECPILKHTQWYQKHHCSTTTTRTNSHDTVAIRILGR